MTTRRQVRSYLRTLIAACALALLITIGNIAGAASPSYAVSLQNPSLEQGSGNKPSCWLLGGYGSNSYQWTWTSDAHSGSHAENLNVTSYKNGDRKLLTSFSGCSPAVTAGHVYTVSVWYKSSAPSAIFAFKNNSSSSGYSWWAGSPQLPTSSSWTQASWTTPVVPSGMSNLSVGLGLRNVGSLTIDDFSLVDSTGTGGATDTTPPTSTISCNDSSCSSGYYNRSVTVSLAATDNSGGSGVSAIRYTTDGTTPTLSNGSTYSGPLVIGTTMTIAYRAYDNAGTAEPVKTQKIQIDQSPPTVLLSAPASGATLTGTATLSATASDNVAVDHVDFLVDGTVVGSDSSSPYSIGWNSASVANGTHTVAARALDAAGNTASSSTTTVAVANLASAPPPPPAPPPPTGGSFSTLASDASGLPRGDGSCASLVTTSTWEPRSDNYTANHTVPSNPSSVPWSNAEIGSYWAKWIANRNLVTGNYTGTTNQIIQWAACKWGLDEDLLRAVAVQESDWHESMVGDNCGSVGEASYGLFQIKNAYCNGGGAWGGYPYSAQDSALNADFYGAYMRSCLDNDFYDGGSWLYGGQTIAQIVAARGLDYAVWGCVGSWFSGGWYDSGAQNYINGVKSHLANKDWLKY
ncbi:MAG TPA: Ig-like domain-containing protein [Solirubrobacteraceae bacterium]|nr:Ig-like domain-containing protein [Solirubrobacteraceae bacterium]